MTLPREIYEHAEDFDQLAILDADGTPASFYRISPRPGTVAQQVRHSASPLYAAAADAVAADVAVSSGRDRTRVRVVPQGDTEDRVTGFLIDARDVEWAPAGTRSPEAGGSKKYAGDLGKLFAGQGR